MNILIATGIYPPDIGGPATYAKNLARELKGRGHGVRVITYGAQDEQREEDGVKVRVVSKSGGPFTRWKRYAKALKSFGTGADIAYALSSVSAGMPLMMSKPKKTKKILRLGGDFLWERYTDWGGSKNLAQFYEHTPLLWRPGKHKMQKLLQQFDHIVFSTAMQRDLTLEAYTNLPPHSVIENALPPFTNPTAHTLHDPIRLLFMGRFVAFKNLTNLLNSVRRLPGYTLTLVGDVPQSEQISSNIKRLDLRNRVTVLSEVHGEAKQSLFAEHDLLVLPSLTEISPNVALEARSSGLPVLLSDQTGLSPELTTGMLLRPMQTVDEIVESLQNIPSAYPVLAKEAATQSEHRSWNNVAQEHVTLFTSLSPQ